MNIVELDKALKAVCPILGVSIGRVNDKSTWRIDFTDEATSEQRAAAQAVVDAFDVNGAEAAAIGEANESARTKRSRAEQVDEIERRMSLGASQEEINTALLNLLRE